MRKHIYNQSRHKNHLSQSLGGYFNGPDVNDADNLASAIGASITLGSKKAYGIFISLGTGYCIDTATGTAIDDTPKGMYVVLDGTYWND